MSSALKFELEGWFQVQDQDLQIKSATTFICLAKISDYWYFCIDNFSSLEKLLNSNFKVSEIKILNKAYFTSKLNTLEKKLSKLAYKSKQVETFDNVYILKDGKFRFQNHVEKSNVELVQKKNFKLFILDDSPVIRKIIKSMVESNTSLTVVGESGDPVEALKKLKDPNFPVDVMTVDIHMPGMLGSQFVKELSKFRYIPSIIVTSLSINEGTLVLDALESGAVDYIQKPTLDQIDGLKATLNEKLEIAANSKKIQTQKQSILEGVTVNPKKVIAIGASTGGTEAIRQILTSLPSEIPPVVIVQHIPAYFSKAFADRLNELCKFKVKEAVHDEVLQKNCVYVAPGGLQMEIIRADEKSFKTKIYSGEKISGHIPSVDVMFMSLTKLDPKNIVSVLLTGMGKDGAKGLKDLHDKGSYSIIQDEASCIVYGMPKAAFQMNAYSEIQTLDKIAESILKQVKL